MNAEHGPKSFGQKLGELIKRKRQAKGLTQLQLAEDAFGTGGKVRRISELENGTVANPQSKTIDPVISILAITDAEIEACTDETPWTPDPEFERAYREARNLIEAAAAQFELAKPEATLVEIEDYLRSKAKEWRDLRDRLDQLGTTDRILNELRVRASEALADGKLKAVDAALAEAEEVQQNEKTLHAIAQQAEIRITRADAALFDEDGDRAFDLYHSAAQFFDPFDRNTAAEMLVELAGRVYETSLRSLTPRFEIARRLLDALADHPATKSNLAATGIANYRRGLIYMNEAVNAIALDFRQHLLDQALSFARLAADQIPIASNTEYAVYARISLSNILLHMSRANRDRSHLQEAEGVLRSALVTAEEEVKDQVPGARNALGGIYLELHNTSETHDRVKFINAAMEQFTLSVIASEEQANIAIWGAARVNRARIMALYASAITNDAKRRAFTRIRCIAEYSAGIETYPATLFPDRFGDANFEMAKVMISHAIDDAGELATDYFIRALNHLHTARGLFSRDSHPHKWAEIHLIAGGAFLEIARAGKKYHSIENGENEALSCWTEALATYDALGDKLKVDEISTRISSLQNSAIF